MIIKGYCYTTVIFVIKASGYKLYNSYRNKSRNLRLYYQIQNKDYELIKLKEILVLRELLKQISIYIL